MVLVSEQQGVSMSYGKPGMRPGIPSPFKKFWVISIQGVFVRLEGTQAPRIPTPFASERDAKAVGSRVYAGEPHYVGLHCVTRQWLTSVTNGDLEIKVQTYRWTSLSSISF